jgi:hypothetical protein
LLFPTCADVHGIKEKARDMPGLRKQRTAAGQALAISIAGTEAGPITFDPKFSPSPRRDEGSSEPESRITRERPEWTKVMAAISGPKACLTSASVSRRPHCQMFQ